MDIFRHCERERAIAERDEAIHLLLPQARWIASLRSAMT
jgi:hypothetical protein